MDLVKLCVMDLVKWELGANNSRLTFFAFYIRFILRGGGGESKTNLKKIFGSILYAFLV